MADNAVLGEPVSGNMIAKNRENTGKNSENASSNGHFWAKKAEFACTKRHFWMFEITGKVFGNIRERGSHIRDNK